MEMRTNIVCFNYSNFQKDDPIRFKLLHIKSNFVFEKSPPRFLFQKQKKNRSIQILIKPNTFMKNMFLTRNVNKFNKQDFSSTKIDVNSTSPWLLFNLFSKTCHKAP
jgi:hypothetical protein